jgi:EAL domain-containing protein (putative c-di-GMP-specific phosphodiesterase class I)
MPLDDSVLMPLLRAALDSRKLALHYQGQSRGVDLAACGVEALLRWDAAGLGTLAAAQFLPAARRAGLLPEISRWVMRTACLQNRRWQEQGLPAVPVVVNLPLSLLLQPGFADQVPGILAQAHLEADKLELDVSIDADAHEGLAAVEALRRLRATGVRLCLDDFGNGAGCLRWLRRDIFDGIKIGAPYVDGLPDDLHASQLMRGIVRLARSLGLRVGAKHIDSRRQLNAVREMRCDTVQGFHLGGPAAPEETARWLRAHRAPVRSRRMAGGY